MINFLIMDVDGTLTDGKIYMGQNGESFKAFDIKDGCGIKEILPMHSITPIVITARKSQILENRCKELGITEVHQGSRQKLDKLKEILVAQDAEMSSVAYAGDDLPDIPCMEAVKKAGGLALCPSDAIPEIKALADYVSGFKAGDGAIRDCINYLVQQNTDNVEKRIKDAINFIFDGLYSDCGEIANGSKYKIQEYTTKEESECILETNRRHIDVQYMIEGHEEFKIYMTKGLTGTGEYNAEKDVEYWQDGILVSHSVLVPGSLMVVYNGQPHKSAIQCCKKEKVRKLVCKIEI